MDNPELLNRRPLSFGEEMANSISHGVALILALAALPVLLLSAVRNGSAHFTVGVIVFGGTMVLL
jgi:hemolysin III